MLFFLKDSNGCADFVIKLLEIKDMIRRQKDNDARRNIIIELENDYSLLEPLKQHKVESYGKKFDPKILADEQDKLFERSMYILEEYEKDSTIINVFRLNNEESQDIDVDILRTFLKSELVT